MLNASVRCINNGRMDRKEVSCLGRDVDGWKLIDNMSMVRCMVYCYFFLIDNMKGC